MFSDEHFLQILFSLLRIFVVVVVVVVVVSKIFCQLFFLGSVGSGCLVGQVKVNRTSIHSQLHHLLLAIFLPRFIVFKIKIAIFFFFHFIIIIIIIIIKKQLIIQQLNIFFNDSSSSSSRSLCFHHLDLVAVVSIVIAAAAAAAAASAILDCLVAQKRRKKFFLSPISRRLCQFLFFFCLANQSNQRDVLEFDMS